MELFLNLLWVLMAACAVGFWRTQWLDERRKADRESLRDWTAMGCALVLLFFAVSLTDDLHAEAMLRDECSASSRHLISAHHSQDPKRIVGVSFPAILPKTAVAQSPHIDFQVFSIGFSSSSVFIHDLSEGRAPPATIL
jgi:hypothetical protein